MPATTPSNASGATATSPTATLNLSLRQPTASAITFARIADALQCHTAREVVKVAGRVRTVRRHGKRVRVRGPARRVRRKVRKCHARTVVRTVRVVLKRHGKPVLRHGKPVYVKRRVRRVVLPHAVNKPTRRIAHGKSTTVSGFVGLANGTALAGQTGRGARVTQRQRAALPPHANGHHQRGWRVDGQGGRRPVTAASRRCTPAPGRPSRRSARP